MTALRPQSTAAAGTSDEQEALAAPVADALWMLARQQQTGEFAAADGGSALRVEMTWSSVPLTLNGTPVPLTPSEFRLLALLAEQPDRPVSRREIMEHLWESRFVGDQRACDTHILNIRRKIEDDPTRPKRLITVRGLGYQLTAG